MTPDQQRTRSTNTAADIDELLTLFEFAHLPPALANASKPFAQLARSMAYLVNGQTVVSLQHLVISKDAAVRAVLQYQRQEDSEQEERERLEAEDDLIMRGRNR